MGEYPNYLYLAYTRTNGLFDWGIRLATWPSRWSHVAIVLPPINNDIWDIAPLVVEARWNGGVQECALHELMQRVSAFQICRVNAGEGYGLASAECWLSEQLGKPYDWSAILGFGVHRDWAQDDAWFCSELAEGACRAMGAKCVDDGLSRIVPADSFKSVNVQKLWSPGELPDDLEGYTDRLGKKITRLLEPADDVVDMLPDRSADRAEHP